MISLKRYLSSNTTETEETLRQLIALFVRKIGESAVVVDQHELDAFTDEIRRVQEALTSDLLESARVRGYDFFLLQETRCIPSNFSLR